MSVESMIAQAASAHADVTAARRRRRGRGAAPAFAAVNAIIEPSGSAVWFRGRIRWNQYDQAACRRPRR
jgi:hypothetical protein